MTIIDKGATQNTEMLKNEILESTLVYKYLQMKILDVEKYVMKFHFNSYSSYVRVKKTTSSHLLQVYIKMENSLRTVSLLDT
jgi:hypothetical protein